MPPPPHVVHLYQDDLSLIGRTANLSRKALASGDSVLVIATRDHLLEIVRQLESVGIDLQEASRSGRFTSLDARETLSRLLVDNQVSQARFDDLVGQALESAAAASTSQGKCVTVFGEMVSLLWADGLYLEAIRLEHFWNELASRFTFSLHCAYPISGFNRPEHTELFLEICGEHSAVIPAGAEFGGHRADDRNDDHTDDRSFSVDDANLRTIAALQQKVQVLERQTALQDSEQRFRLLVEAVRDYAIFMLDTKGNIASWNMGAERIKGYKASEIIGKHFSMFYPDEDRDKPARELEIAIRDGRVEDEGWRIRKDGSKFWASVVITALRDKNGKLFGFAKVTRDITERLRNQQALEESQRRLQISERSLRDLSLHLLRTQDEERRQIGRDLHDSLGQYLSVLKMRLDALRTAAVRSNSPNADELEQCSQLMNEAVQEVRTISYLLYPPMLEEMGLKTAVPWYLDGFAQRSGIKTDFEVSSSFGRLDRDTELALFRVLQESLTNIHRHSGATQAKIRLGTDADIFFVEVSDNGHGIPVQKFEEAGQDWMGSRGVGLRGMTERLHQIGGKLEISSTGKGTVVRAVVPLASVRQGAAKSS